jgi:hypothetical protein
VSGIGQFVARYLDDNDDVQGLVEASGLPHRSQVSLGVIETQLVLPTGKHPDLRAGDQLPA